MKTKLPVLILSTLFLAPVLSAQWGISVTVNAGRPYGGYGGYDYYPAPAPVVVVPQRVWAPPPPVIVVPQPVYVAPPVYYAPHSFRGKRMGHYKKAYRHYGRHYDR